MKRLSVVAMFLVFAVASQNVYGQWKSLTAPPSSEYFSIASVGTKVLFVGRPTIDVYDESDDSWSELTLPHESNVEATLTIGTKVFFTGGTVIDIYDDATGDWSTVTLSDERFGYTIASYGTKIMFAGGGVTVINGHAYTEASDVVDIYDTDGPSMTSTTLPIPGYRMKTITIGDKIFLGSGQNAIVTGTGNTDRDTGNIFDTIEGDWSTVSFPSNGDIYDDGASIGNKVFFTGLRDGEVRGPDFESEYVAETNSWSASIDLAPNTLFTSMPLNERHVTTIGETALFIGGRPGGGAWSTDVWLYNNTTSHMRVTNLPGVVPRAVSTRLGNKLYITGQTTNKINVYNADALTDFTVDDDITACGGTPFTLTASGASSYTWQPDPALSTTTGSSVVVTPDASGSEWFTLYLTGVDDDGWESTYRIKVTVKPSPAKPVATLDTSGLVNVLTSNFESGNQWFSNNVEIEDAVTQQFFLVNPGSYSVQVTVDGCKSPMSDPVNYQILGDDDDGRSFKTIVYPNPVSDRLNFQWGGFSDHEKIDVKIVDVIGRTVYHKESSTTDGGIDASSFTDGIYFVIASQREARQVIRVIKK